jgi:uncharacterized protein YjbJ (UPF0337 family)
MTDETNDDAKAAGRARQAKGSVQEAIGKIIGDAAVEKRGARESEAGARQAGDDAPPSDADDKD